MKDFIIIFLLSFSWILIWFLFKLTYRISSYLLIALPINLYIRFWRISKGVFILRYKILESKKITGENTEIDQPIKLIDSELAKLQKSSYKVLYSQTRWSLFLRTIFFHDDLKSILVSTLKENEKILESDQLIIKTISDDPDFNVIKNHLIHYNTKITAREKKALSD